MKLKIDRTPLLAIAKIIKVFGVRGELKIFSYARTAEEYQSLPQVFCGRTENDAAECSIEHVRMRGNDIYITLRTVNDRTAAERLVGQFLFVEETHRKELPRGRHFIDDLIGCTVVNEEQHILGTVTGVDTHPGQMLCVVRTSSGTVLVPMVDAIVKSVDVKNKKIVVTPPEGLFTGEML